MIRTSIANQNKKMASFMIPKRSYDFDKFAFDSMPETETFKEAFNDDFSLKKVQLIKNLSPSDSNQAKQIQTNFQIDPLPLEDSFIDLDSSSNNQLSIKTQNIDSIKQSCSTSEYLSKPSTFD